MGSRGARQKGYQADLDGLGDRFSSSLMEGSKYPLHTIRATHAYILAMVVVYTLHTLQICPGNGALEQCPYSECI